MKARIKNPMPAKLLGINISTEKSEKIKAIAKKYNVEFSDYDGNCAGEQVGFLCGFNGFKKSDKNQNTDKELLLFSSVARNTLNKILEELRKENAQVELKAVVTAYNQIWTISHLAEEIEKEHKTMNGGKING